MYMRQRMIKTKN